MNPRPALCILHCGTEKTGSTTLQRFLAMHAPKLQEQGIWIPRALVHRPDISPFNHIKMSTTSHLSVNKPDDLQRMLGCESMDDVRRHRSEVAEELELEFKSLDFLPDRIIISNEHIHSRLRKLEDIFNLKEMLAPYCQKFQVVVYLRDQLSLANSLTSTSLRNGKTDLRFIPDFSEPGGFDPVLGTDFEYYNYETMLQRLEEAFGFDSMTVRLYDHIVRDGRDIIDDFFENMSADIEKFTRPVDENAGLNRIGALLFAELNKVERDNPEMENSLRKIKRYIEKQYKGKIPVYMTPQARIFSDLYAESNERVRQKWFPTR